MKSAAAGQGVTADTIFRWVAAGWVVHRYLPGERGRVRVLQGPDGRTVDADTPDRPSALRPHHPPRWVSVREAAAAAGVTVLAVRGWVRRRQVVYRRPAGGHGRRLELALDWDGLPADASNAEHAARVAAAATATAAQTRETAERAQLADAAPPERAAVA